MGNNSSYSEGVMANEPPKMCGTCPKNPCEGLCPELAAWLDETYRDHYSVDTPEEHRWPVEIDVSDARQAIIVEARRGLGPLRTPLEKLMARKLCAMALLKGHT